MRTRSPAIPGTGSPGSLLRILLALVACLGLTTPLMSQPASASESTLSNPGFETGDLSGWTATGTAFNGSVTDQPGWGWGCCFNQQGTYHLWGFAGGGDAPTGTVTSEPFTLTGTGMVSALVSGGRNDDQLYVALTTLDGTILQGHRNRRRGVPPRHYGLSRTPGVSCRTTLRCSGTRSVRSVFTGAAGSAMPKEMPNSSLSSAETSRNSRTVSA